MKKTKKQNFTKYFDIVKKYSDEIGTSGYETKVRELFKKELKNHVDGFEFDNLGSVIAYKKAKNSKFSILIDAHMDEIGFMVSRIDKEGFIWFNPLGGWWGHALLGKRLRIVTKSGKIIIGIVGSKPIHILPVKEREKVIAVEDMYIDIGVSSKEEVLNLGINIGDFIVKDADAFLMANDKYICAKAIDNRASCAVVSEVMKAISKMKLDKDVYGALSVQEEVGLRGAQTMAYKIKPSIALIIDTTLSYDQPGMPAHDCKLDEGVAFTLMDRTIISHYPLIQKCIAIAEKNKIKFTFNSKVAGGTNGGTVHLSRSGIPTVVVSIPTRYLHTHNEVCSLADIEEIIKFLICFIDQIKYEDYLKLINY